MKLSRKIRSITSKCIRSLDYLRNIKGQIGNTIDGKSLTTSNEVSVLANGTNFIRCTTKTGIKLLLRPVKISDVYLLQDFFSLLSKDSLYSRYHSARKVMTYEQLQNFITIDYRKEMIILALLNDSGIEEVVGMGEYRITGKSLIADIALTVRDDFQNLGIGRKMFSYLTQLARNEGILGFTADVLADNTSLNNMSENIGIEIEKNISYGICNLRMLFEPKIA
ncbi:MAG: GNAT family N-acetyltransferase [Candidatus Dadabacteria bacterium]|nr:GNAT family N-acetyltransferase [Candidatus Dadabacteria bacterium]